MEGKQLNITITTGTVVKTILVILGFATLYYLRDLALVILTAIIIASAIEPGIKWFSRYHVSRVPAVLLLYALVVAVIVFAIIFIAPPIIEDLGKLSSAAPQLAEKFSLKNLLPFEINQPAISGKFFDTFSFAQVAAYIQQILTGLSQDLFQTVSFIFGGVINFVLIVVLSFYLAIQERGIESVLRVITPTRHEKHVIDLWGRSQYKIGQWLKGQLLLAVLIAILVFLGLTIIGVQYAIVLALLAGLLELIPYFGPIMAAIPAVILGFGQAPIMGLMVLGLYIIIQQFENHLIVPLVITKIVGIPPLLVILALVIGAKLAGFLGFVLAAPVAAVLMELYNDLEKKKLKIGAPGS